MRAFRHPLLWASLTFVSVALLLAAFVTPTIAQALGAPTQGRGTLAQQSPAHKIIFYPTYTKGGAAKKPRVLGSGDLVYNGGPVLKNPVTYAIFWGSYWNNGSGGVTPDAQIVLNFFNDLGTTQFENILTQYHDTSGPIANTEHLAAYWNDTATPPTDTACLDLNNQPVATVEDSSIATEVAHAISVKGWPGDLGNAVYLVYTPPNVYVRAGSACSAQQFCAYHTISGVPYAAEPYPVQARCPALQSPNGNVAGDSLASSSSHELFESITDPITCGYGCSAAGWLDNANYEVADKCAWDFSGGNTNLNNGGVFYIQTEYSNASHTCVNAYNSPPRMQMAPTSVSLNTPLGANPPDQPLTLTNITWNTLNWSAGSLPSWVSVTPSSGSFSAGGSQQLTLKFNITVTAPQTLTTQLTLSGNADNSPLNVPISVTVLAGSLNGLVSYWPSLPTCPSQILCSSPMPQQQVQIKTTGGALVTTVMTDQQGAFSIWLAPGSYVAHVPPDPTIPGLRQRTPGGVTITAGAVTPLTILMDSRLR